MDPVLTVTAVGAMAGLAVVLTGALAVAHRFLHVEEDPRIDAVEGMLPLTNCGACGFPGCRAFAEALVGGAALPAKCSVSTDDQRVRIASYLKVSVGQAEKMVARLACAGGTNVARNHARYDGVSSCAGAALVAGGGKGCFWGCLGLGDCEVSCDFDAITMDGHGLPVVDEDRCTACGDCVMACPKDLFSLVPQRQRLWVACKSHAEGDGILADCQVGCTACGRCAMDAPGVIEMQDGLPVIDYSKGPVTAIATQRCPTGAIVWLDEKGRATKGEAARKVIREGSRPNAPT